MSFDLSTIASSDLEFTPTADNVVVAPAEEQVPSNILVDKKGTFGSLERIPEIKAKVEAEKPKVTPQAESAAPVVEGGITLEKIVNKLEAETETTPGTPGRPRTDKNAINEYLKTKIESGDFFTWNDYDEKKESLDEYLNKLPEKDVYDLLDKNIEKQANKGYEEAPQELREALPPKAQYVIDYIAQGGTDLETLFSSLARATQIEKLDPTNDAHMPEIAKNYLQLINFGSQESINSQVDEWAENGKLESKVKEFKPKLDAMHEQQVQLQIQQEAEYNRQRQEAAQAYVQNVGAVLQKYEVGGLKLSKKNASELYYDLTEANYPSISGKPTNIIGHKLEEIQYVKPDFDFLAEIAWHLRDREGYNNAQATKAKSEKAQEIARELKDAQYIRTQVTPVEDPAEKKIQKQFKPRNVFSK